MENNVNDSAEKREEIFSKAVRAGKRTYFFDVKATRGDDYYLTITESKKRFSDDGKFFFEKHKLFLYKEDFEKFSNGLTEAIGYIQEEKGVYVDTRNEDNNYQTEAAAPATTQEPVAETADSYTDVKFEDI